MPFPKTLTTNSDKQHKQQALLQSTRPNWCQDREHDYRVDTRRLFKEDEQMPRYLGKRRGRECSSKSAANRNSKRDLK